VLRRALSGGWGGGWGGWGGGGGGGGGGVKCSILGAKMPFIWVATSLKSQYPALPKRAIEPMSEGLEKGSFGFSACIGVNIEKNRMVVKGCRGRPACLPCFTATFCPFAAIFTPFTAKFGPKGQPRWFNPYALSRLARPMIPGFLQIQSEFGAAAFGYFAVY
jgi:hypothetical protein